jgi:hypothetical protein
MIINDLFDNKKTAVAEGEVVPFRRAAVSWQKLPKDVLSLANDWFWADFEGGGLQATMDPKGLGSGFANQQKYLGAQLQQRGWAIDIDDEYENIVLKNQQGQTVLLPIEDAQNFTSWAQDTNPVSEQGMAEGWKDVVAGGALALGALGAGAQTMPNINAQQVELTNKYYNALVQRAKEDGRELDRRTLNFLKAKAEDAAALKLQQASPKKQQGFPAQGSERRVSRNIDNFESQGVAEGMSDDMAAMAQKKFPNAYISKDGEEVQKPKNWSKRYTPPAAAPADLEKQQRDLTAKYPNIDELVRRAELNRDPDYEMADGEAYYAARDAEQNYQKLRQIQRVIQGLNESLNRSHLP